MIAAVLHDRVPRDASKDELDTLVQVDAVSRALAELGFETVPVEFSYDIESFIDTLRGIGPGFVFNLVETLRDRGRFIGLAPLVLDHLGIPYTGCPSCSLSLTSNKPLAKRIMSAAGIPTPPWVSLDGAPGAAAAGDTYLIKSAWEHASIGVDGGASVRAKGGEELRRILEERGGSGVFFAERYVEGREFNLSLLAGAGTPGRRPPGRRALHTARPAPLAPAEMVFENFPAGRLRILDYSAKWDEGSYEFAHTVRRFDFPDGDRPLLDLLVGIALRCWEVFGLNGYARVDFRVEEGGRPFVLEVNANPCISPDSGFAAAAERSGVGYKALIERIAGSLVVGA